MGVSGSQIRFSRADMVEVFKMASRGVLVEKTEQKMIEPPPTTIQHFSSWSLRTFGDGDKDKKVIRGTAGN